jgi:hypothetical protein
MNERVTMVQKISCVVSSTLHEPQFRLKSALLTALPTIKNLFSEIVICCTSSTGKEVKDFLLKQGFLVPISPSLRQFETYKLALSTALECIKNPENQKIFYIDFDRLIHWINNYPEELRSVLNNVDVDNLHIGRTSRAFNTHPLTQITTERIANEFGSKLLGAKNTKDIISVCNIFTKELGERILKVNNTTAAGFYCSWPVCLWRWAEEKRYIEVEGQEWETPDRFQKEIKQMGYEKWLEQFQSPFEWEKRVLLLQECLHELYRIHGA